MARRGRRRAIVVPLVGQQAGCKPAPVRENPCGEPDRRGLGGAAGAARVGVGPGYGVGLVTGRMTADGWSWSW